MSVLVVIGNGFDLFHGLPTRYADFKAFVALNYPELLETIEQYYDFSEDPSPWCRIEEELANFDHQGFFDDNNTVDLESDNVSSMSAFPVRDDLDQQGTELVETILDALREWVETVEQEPLGTVNGRFPTGARFLNFNYTDSLQRAYHTPDDQVLHIHGSIKQQSDLIFGHGKNGPRSRETEEEPGANRTMFTDAENTARYPLSAMRKPVRKILESNKIFFKSLEGVDRVVVLGHSMGAIDRAYFTRIIKGTRPGTPWTVSWYSENDRLHAQKEFRRFGIADKVVFKPMEEILRDLLKKKSGGENK